MSKSKQAIEKYQKEIRGYRKTLKRSAALASEIEELIIGEILKLENRIAKLKDN